MRRARVTTLNNVTRQQDMSFTFVEISCPVNTPSTRRGSISTANHHLAPCMAQLSVKNASMGKDTRDTVLRMFAMPKAGKKYSTATTPPSAPGNTMHHPRHMMTFNASGAPAEVNPIGTDRNMSNNAFCQLNGLMAFGLRTPP